MCWNITKFEKVWSKGQENFGHLYRDGEITAVVRDLRLSLMYLFLRSRFLWWAMHVWVRLLFTTKSSVSQPYQSSFVLFCFFHIRWWTDPELGYGPWMMILTFDLKWTWNLDWPWELTLNLTWNLNGDLEASQDMNHSGQPFNRRIFAFFLKFDLRI